MAEPVYLLMAYRPQLDGWSTLRACSTLTGAMRAAEALLSRRFDSAFKGLANWSASLSIKPPQLFPGRFIKAWSARSVGGIGGNPWSCIAVAELTVEDDVLERLAEV